MRLDIYLAENGIAQSRSKAQTAISEGRVFVNGIKAEKASLEINGDENIEFIQTDRFVSRAGEKLFCALKEFNFDTSGMTALDIGASTGGFTDCLLQNGADYVYALDVGHSQLDAKLRNDDRVCCTEGCNARYAKKEDFDREIDLIVMDVSFISQTLIYPACADILAEGKTMITLIKPQFEAGKKHIGKGGIVRDPKGQVIKEILQRLDESARICGFTRIGFCESSILGGDGNREYLAIFKRNQLG